MGRPKLLLPWNDSTVLGHLIDVWSRLGADQTIVVCTAGDVGIQNELDRLGFSEDLRIVNTSPGEMFSSIRCASRWQQWKGSLTHWAVILGDQPHVQFSTLEAVVVAVANHPDKIVQPCRRLRPRHPVLMPRKYFNELRSTSTVTLRQYLQMRSTEIELIQVDDAGLDFDIDTPADYERARELSRSL